MAEEVTPTEQTRAGFVRGLGLLDSTMIVAGSMIGSGIFIVSSIIARQVGSPGWLLVVWIITGLLTLMAALFLGERIGPRRTTSNRSGSASSNTSNWPRT